MEDGRLLAGEGQYVGNVALPGMLHMKVVRSPHAHALIRSIDVSGAVAVPGVVAVHTGRDLVDDLKPMPSAHIPGLLTPERHTLATQRVRLVGDPVAVVVATSLSVAADAADLVEVDYGAAPGGGRPRGGGGAGCASGARGARHQHRLRPGPRRAGARFRVRMSWSASGWSTSG